MYAYIARQPIFNINKKVEGYELLYRDGVSGNKAEFADSDTATCSVLSDAITLFGLPMLTNKQRAFINFTQNLIMNDFVLVTNPDEIVIEILEDVDMSEEFLAKVEELKKAGYRIALDDYTGKPEFDPLLELVDIVKVDFRVSPTKERRRMLADKLKKYRVKILAEKLEVQDDFDMAIEYGYELFQGYFFEKPKVFNKRVPSLSGTSYGSILNELQKPTANFDTCAKIIYTDASMTYMIMKKVQSLYYYRGNPIVGIKLALVMMGVTELKRYIILMMARKNNITHSDELVRKAYLRGLFIEKLIQSSNYTLSSDQGFLMGMFSLLDRILGASLTELLKDIDIDSDVKEALIGIPDNDYAQFLKYVMVYEMGNPRLVLPDIGLTIGDKAVSDMYMGCIVNTDAAFNDMGGAS